jgi:hypothetical protein
MNRTPEPVGVAPVFHHLPLSIRFKFMGINLKAGGQMSGAYFCLFFEDCVSIQAPPVPWRIGKRHSCLNVPDRENQ